MASGKPLKTELETSILVGLLPKPLGLCAEFNSASNIASFEGRYNGKVCVRLEIMV